jgi:hypothetical protein
MVAKSLRRREKKTVIDPKSVLIAIPAFDGRWESVTGAALFEVARAGMASNLAKLDGNSHIALARNMIAHSFLKSPFEWLVFIDADIGFTVDDFAILMDYAKDAPPPLDAELEEAATLLSLGEKPKLWETPALVSCEYARKIDNAPPARLGLGFARIHRSVFASLDALTLETGEARIDSFMYQGQHVSDYFLSGCVEHRYMTEDTGFFSLCRLAGIHPRVEQRTNLVHVGKRVFPYYPQNAIAQ